MVANGEKPLLELRTAAEWEAWLEEAHETSPGVRLLIAKKGREGLHVEEALDTALCFGWIDGTRYANDADTFIQSYGPRRPTSVWSQVNREHIERLAAAGRMRPRGLAEVERAKADGRWAAAYRAKGAPVPDDLRAALDASPAASAAFEALSGQNRFSVLYRIGNAKRAQTRAARIARTIEMLEHGETSTA